jgi:2-polyprenyl-3-methyl-5-hydroxy-6-metoxy-1,4-benzoquinol methylase
MPFTYNDKPAAYFGTPRDDLIAMVSGEGLRILDIGCGSGATGAALLRVGKAAWVSGCELVPEQAQTAAAVLNEVLVGDISQIALPWPPESFDCVIAGDVLEHLVDPWHVLTRLRPLLRQDGVLLVSLPNVTHWPVIYQLLLKNEWHYQTVGVMDRTHLRFFTRRSAEQMLVDCGYAVQETRPHFWTLSSQRFNRLTRGLAVRFLAERWLFRAYVNVAWKGYVTEPLKARSYHV